MSQMLTPGQLRIREIIYELLPKYKQLNSIDEFRSFRSNLRERFSVDPIISEDLCVCQSLKKPKKIAKSYLRWLYAMSSCSNKIIVIKDGEYLVNLDKFIYSPCIIKGGSYEEAYKGGDKDYTTYQALFSFAENKGHEISRGDWSVLYYEEDGILKISGGGSHRTLACVLWGQHLIAPETLYVIKNLSDPNLHKALLIMESYLQSTGLEFAIYHELKESNDETKTNLSNEAFDIKEFIRIAMHEEINMIVKFLRYDIRNHLYGYLKLNCWNREHTVVINNFFQILHEYREIKSRTWNQRIIARITRKSKISKGEITLFENWIFENYDVYQ